MPLDLRLVALVAAVALAFAVETALGFGATVVTVSLGALLVPIDVLLPAFVPLNLALSATVFLRARRHVAWRLLWLGVVPWMALGLPVGMLAFARLDERSLERGFGAFLVLLSVVELYREARKARAARLPPTVEKALLVLGGALHGAFATGGPMVVYVLGRSLGNKASLRATMALLWLVMNAVLVVQYAVEGRVSAKTVGLSLPLAVGLGAGMAMGELLFVKMPEALFRKLVFALLLVAGVVLIH